MIKKFKIDGLVLMSNSVFKDDRGLFFESFNQKQFNETIGEKIDFVQDNLSISKKNVVRGLHFQKEPFAQGKLVQVVQGKAIDVVVDIRKNSPTYGKHISVELSDENNNVFWIPEGFAHGFIALEDNTVFSYKCTHYYDSKSEGSLLWNDEMLAIDWGVENPILSDKDQMSESFSDFISPFL
jgi:dTDP-4-dehydrorhamnose 3,5-epimerase